MHRFKTFLSDTRGSVTYYAVLGMLPLAGVLGLGADYSRAIQVRTEVQSALDSTVLMLTREAPKKDAAALKKIADPYFAALATRDPKVTVTGLSVGKTDKTVSVATVATVPTFFGGVYAYLAEAGGFDKWTINVRAEAGYATKKIELALVLDNTGSMASANKIQELKKASHTLLTILEQSVVKADQVKVALVPYTTRVNLGKSFKEQPWLTTTPTGTFEANGANYVKPANRDLWQGCVADRDTGYNNSALPYSLATEASKYPMMNCSDGIAQAMPLTSNFAALHKRIDEMKASGWTNITLGAQWGLEMLSGNAPFTEASADSDVERFMILLTDGNNTVDRWTKPGQEGWAATETRMNKDTQAMCDAIVERPVPEAAKKMKIKLYTVLVIDGNQNLLKNCASNPSMFKKVNQASELEAVFRKIAEDIGTIRLTM